MLPQSVVAGLIAVPAPDVADRMAGNGKRTGRIDWQLADLSGRGHWNPDPRPVGQAAMPYVYAFPRLARTRASAAMRDVLSHPNRGTSREGEASIALSHRDEAPAPLTWWGGTNDLRTCLMIVKTTDSADRLTNLRHRR